MAIQGIDNDALAKLQGADPQTSWDKAGLTTLNGIKHTLGCILSLGVIVLYQQYNAPKFDKLVSKFGQAIIKATDAEKKGEQRIANAEKKSLQKQLVNRIITVIGNEKEPTETVKKVVSTVKALIKNAIENEDEALIKKEVDEVIAAVAQRKVEARFADPLDMVSKESVSKAAENMETVLEKTGLAPDAAKAKDLVNKTISRKIKDQTEAGINTICSLLRKGVYRHGGVDAATDAFTKDVRAVLETSANKEKDWEAKDKEVKAKKKEIHALIQQIHNLQEQEKEFKLAGAAIKNDPEALAKNEQELNKITAKIDAAVPKLHTVQAAKRKLVLEQEVLYAAWQNANDEFADKYLDKGIDRVSAEDYRQAYKKDKATADVALLKINTANLTATVKAESLADATLLSDLYTA